MFPKSPLNSLFARFFGQKLSKIIQRSKLTRQMIVPKSIKIAPHSPKIAPDSIKIVSNSAKIAFVSFKIASESPKIVSVGSKIAPDSSKIVSISVKIEPDTPKTASLRQSSHLKDFRQQLTSTFYYLKQPV